MTKEKVKKPIYKRVWFWLVIIIVIAAAFGSTGGDDEGQVSEGAEGVESQEPIEYTACTVDEMMTLLAENALNASDTYMDQYIEVTGRLSTIDSSGNYISLHPQNDPYAFIGVQCYIQDDAQKEIVSALTVDQIVTVRGQITNVGEVLGYSLDINSFVQ